MSRLDEILHEVGDEKRREQERQRELDQLRRAAIAAVELSNAARAKIYAPEEVPLGSQQVADRNYKRARAVRKMKQGKVNE